ncbi:MAG TPA: peptidylprolyl isomerase [Pyrinomonadaceae bacterium]|nr:peptidylprolyl isomerase [Pyrinomonadaceae bacterium]
MLRRNALIIVALIAIVAAAAVFWKMRQRTVEAARHTAGPLTTLTEAEIVAMLQHQTLMEPDRVHAIVANAATRKIFLNGLRDYLGLAAKARSVGLADDPNIKLNVEYKKNLLLAGMYQNKLDNDNKRFYEIPKEATAAFWSNPQNEKQFQAEINGLRAVQQSVKQNSGNPLAVPDLQGEAWEKNRNQWAKTRILSNMAKADAGFMNQQAIQLRLRVVEAGVLAFNYLNKYWLKDGMPAEDEIDQYLAAHPEYDVTKKREKAVSLLQRAKGGEDFEKLAEEFSEDDVSKSEGGLYENVGIGFLWQEVEDVALGLSKGQIADRLVETKYGYHVVQLVDSRVAKDQNGDDATKLSVRHILLRKTFAEPGTPLDSSVPPSFMEARDIAVIVLKNEKRRRFIDEIVKAESISLPDDFAFEVTEELKTASRSVSEQMRELISKDKAKKDKKGK